LDAKVADILKSIREGKWIIAHIMLGKLNEGDLTTVYDEFEVAALLAVKPLPASDLSGNQKG
jgi:hypothetical protein